MSRSALERARYYLEGIELRGAERIERGDLGEWQTELNEVRRVLSAILEHLEPPPRYVVEEPDDTPY
jgi:hypothetical protein